MYPYNSLKGISATLLEAKAKGKQDRREVEACTASELEPSTLFRRQQQTIPNITCAGKMLVPNDILIHSSKALGLRLFNNFIVFSIKPNPIWHPRHPDAFIDTHTKHLATASTERWLAPCFAFVASPHPTKLQNVSHHSHPRDSCKNRSTETATDGLTSPKIFALFNPKTVACVTKEILHHAAMQDQLYARPTLERAVAFNMLYSSVLRLLLLAGLETWLR